MFYYPDTSTVSKEKIEEIKKSELFIHGIPYAKKDDLGTNKVELLSIVGYIRDFEFYRNDRFWAVVSKNGVSLNSYKRLARMRLNDTDVSDIVFPRIIENADGCRLFWDGKDFDGFAEVNSDYKITMFTVHSVIGMTAFLNSIIPSEKMYLVKFNDLGVGVKADVLEHWNEEESFNDHYGSYIISEKTLELSKLFNEPEISYSGFCSQGDGASFTCKRTKITEELLEMAGIKIRCKRLLDLYLSEASFRIERSSCRYYHENSVNVLVDSAYCNRNKIDQYLIEISNELDAWLTTYVRKESVGIYQELSEAYDYFTSAECAMEQIDANDYLFCTNGKLFGGDIDAV